MLAQHFKNRYTRTVRHKMKKLNNLISVFRIMKIEDHTDCRVNIILKRKTCFIGIGKKPHGIFNKPKLDHCYT